MKKNLPKKFLNRKSYFINHILVSFFTSLSLTLFLFTLQTTYFAPKKVHATASSAGQQGISPAQRGQVLGEKTLLAKLYLKGGGATPSQISYGTDIGFDPDGNGTAEVKVTSAGNLDFTKKLTEDGNEILANIITVFDAACPTGWTAVTAFEGQMLRGAASYGGTGGADTHTHAVDPAATSTNVTSAHSHTVDIWPSNKTGTILTEASASHTYIDFNAGAGAMTPTWSSIDALTFINYGKRETDSSENSHTHSTNIASFSSGSGSTLPAYTEVVYCKKNVGADYAEWIKSQEKYSPGTVVSASSDSQEQIKITEKEYDPTLLGIISTTPGWIIGKEAKDSLLLSLAGQVPVNVTTFSGPIKPGDSLTSSDIPGTAMKAIQAGPILGKALEEFDPQGGKGKSVPCPPNSPQNIQCGQITAFVDLSWYDPQVYLTSTGNLHFEDSQKENLVLKDKDDNLITRIGAFAEIAAAKIKAGLIQTKKLTVDDIDILEKLNQLSDKIASQQTEIDSLKKEIEELKNKYNN